jgi:putative SOS response-associated peptidase YedK
MCGAAAQTRRGIDYFIAKMQAEKVFEGDLPDRYNIRPTQQTAVIVDDDGFKIKLMKFGLIPRWSKSGKMEFSTFNAKSETVDKLATYAKPLLEHRAAVIVDGFYEFKKTEEGSIPFYFTLKDGEPFLLAAVFDINTVATDKPIESYSIITTAANDIVGEVHPRMPVILSLEDAKDWLNPDNVEAEGLKKLLKPFPEKLMQSWRVSKFVNNSRNEGIDLIKPV